MVQKTFGQNLFSTSVLVVKTLRVLSYNIHKGFSASNRQLVLAEIRNQVRSLGADLLFLQEVVGSHLRHSEKVPNYPTESQFEYIADSVWPHFAYGQNAVYPHGHHGNAILSLMPIVSWHNLDLSTNRWERRGLLHAVVNGPLGPLNVFSLHLNLFERGRRAQTTKIVDYIKAITQPSEGILLAGDFNDWGGSLSDTLRSELNLCEAYQEMHGHHAKTFPSILPFLRLDRIYFRNLKVKEARCLGDKQWARLSDHCPLTADFDFESR